MKELLSKANQHSPGLKAVALEYSETENLHRVVAQGVDALAQKIVKIAEDHQIPITENGALAETLSQLSTSSSLEADAVSIIMDTICFLYQVEAEYLSQE